MRLLKRRSAPTFAHDPPPSTFSLVDLPGPGVASTSTSHAPPLLPPLPKSHSAFDIHHTPLPNKPMPTPRTPIGAEYPEAHNNPIGGNVFSSLRNLDGSDEDRRWLDHSESASVKARSMTAVAAGKRDSEGQNRYPPNSLVPGSGWGFGRMRKSRRPDVVNAIPPLRRDSLS